MQYPAAILIACGFLNAAGLSRAQAPWAATQPAAPVGPTSATLNGMATPQGLPTTAWFEWGNDGNYNQATGPVDVGSGGKVVRVSAAVNGLSIGAVYHYRLVAINSSGVTYGADHQFTTGTRISTWGDFTNGRLPLPGKLTNVVAIGCGHTQGLAVRNDGTVAAWMSYLASNVGQTNLPVGLSNVVAVTGGWVHSLALRQDGTVLAWGRYFDNGNDIEAAYVPPGISNVIAIAGGDEHSVGLKADGTVTVWGVNSHGQLNVPANVTNVVAIAAGSTHTLALKSDGTVVAWGTSVGGDMTPPQGLSNVVAISTEGWHNLALRANGTVVAWGSTQFGQSSVPPLLSNVVAIAEGFEHCLALKGNGVLVAWGTSAYVSNLPRSLVNPVAIASGDFLSLAIATTNLPPVSFSTHLTGLMNNDLVVSMNGWDPNGDALNFRNASLPANGALYQFTINGRGDPINSTNTLITDPLGRVIFAPAPDSFGVPYASFSYASDDGQNESTPVVVTLNVVTRPVIQSASFGTGANSRLVLSFAGISNVSYQIRVSPNMENWSVLGYASQPSPGQFLFVDSSPINALQRFYRINLIEP